MTPFSTGCYAYFVLGEKAEFVDEAEKAVALNPDHAAVVGPLGSFMAAAGEWERGHEWVARAKALNPNYPGWINYSLISYHLRSDDLDTALDRAQDYVAKMPEYYWAHIFMAAVLGQMDRIEEAGVALDKALALEPTVAEDIRGKLSAWYYEPGPVAPLIAGLRKAGLDIPDEPATAD